jgi:hypothetical protein
VEKGEEMIKSRRFRTDGLAYQRLKAQNKIFDLYDDVEILTEEIDNLTEVKEQIIENHKNKEAYDKGKTHDVSEITIAVSYPREMFRPPSEWDWNLIVKSFYAACDAEYLCGTIPHPDSPTW